MQNMHASPRPPLSVRSISLLLGPLLAIAALLASGVAGAGAADPTSDGKPATIVSDAATITGTKAPDVIVAGDADNTIHGEGGNDTICAGGGNDTIYGERGADQIEGGDGSDLLEGEQGNDTVEGGPGDRDIVEGN